MKWNVRVRTRDETSGPRAGYRAGSGAVDLMLELLSCHAMLPADEPSSSYRSDSEIVVVTYKQALQAFRMLVAFAGRNQKGVQRRPGEGTVWASSKRRQRPL